MKTLVVSSMRAWVARDFSAAADPDQVRVVADLGLDLPEVGTHGVAWWAPAEHAARVRHAGVHVPLVAPGPTWLARRPAEMLGRNVWAGQLKDVSEAPRSGWAKPAEAKVASLPARWWDDTNDFQGAAVAAGMPLDSWVQVADQRLDLVVEHRLFVVDGAVKTSSPYLLKDGTTWYPGMETRNDLSSKEAWEYATSVTRDLGDDQPRSYVLDVALLTDGRWVVIEANPTWCAGSYGSDMREVLTATLQSVDHEGDQGSWHWEPDPYLQRRAEQQRTLQGRRKT